MTADAPSVPADAPSPEVAAIYLRPHNGFHHAHNGFHQVHPSETLVDSITRIVTEMLEQHIRESVTAAVRALAPRLMVSFPPPSNPGPVQPDRFVQGTLDDDVLSD